MNEDWTTTDERIDPRLRAVFAVLGQTLGTPDIPDRDELVAVANAPQALAERRAYVDLLDRVDTEEVASFEGLHVDEHHVTSRPDGNTINVRIVRPDDDVVRPAVYYIHGGGMQTSSCYDGNYRAWARLIAQQGVVVAMVDFRNALQPSSVEQIAPYPAGLDDCESGLRWLLDSAAQLRVDPERVVVSGESGGGNLAIATTLRFVRAGDADRIAGLYAFCPFIAGSWPRDEFPSSVRNEGIFLTLHGRGARHAYGIEAFEARDPMAWPGFATEDDVRGFPPTVINVNECDPLRDEGVAFYRLLLRAGVPARCREIVGTIHGTEVMPAVCPEISRDAAVHLADLARTAREKPAMP